MSYAKIATYGNSNMKEPTLFKVKLLISTAYNDSGDILKIKLEDKNGDIYYYDGCDRWCYLEKEEENIIWEKIIKIGFGDIMKAENKWI